MNNLSPTVVLVSELESNSFITKSWLETNGYNVRAVSDVYDVVEEMTDMMLEQRPDMILLHSYSSPQDCSWVIDSLSEMIGQQNILIVAISNTNNQSSLADTRANLVEVGNFDLLKPLMQTLLPIHRQASATA